MKHPNDKSLEFLHACPSDELATLVEIVASPSSQRITSELCSTENYKKFYPDHSKYVDELIEDYQKFGGNTMANMVRGYGVTYAEILRDVAEHVKVNFNPAQSDDQVEEALLSKVLKDYWQNLTPESRKEAMAELKIDPHSFGGASADVLLAVFKAGGFKSYQVLLMLANWLAKLFVGRGLSIAANAGLTKVASVVFGPIGWIVGGAWTMLDIASPAYRVTVPATVYIAILRRIHDKSQQTQEN